MSNYGWLITADRLAEGDANPGEPGTYANAVGLMGPSDLAPAVEESLKAGAGAEFRMYDDDGVLYYEGRFLGDVDGEEAFGPLDDFGKPNAGAVRIDYKRGSNWETL
jgi:hypothetical protein